MRQKAYDDFITTDDHLMHIIGLAKDQNGTKLYYTKNSWGTVDTKYDGYWYMSEPFVKFKNNRNNGSQGCYTERYKG